MGDLLALLTAKTLAPLAVSSGETGWVLWLVAGLAFLAVAVVFSQWMVLRRRVGIAWATKLSLLRLVTLALLMLALINPLIITYRRQLLRPALALLIDTSGSMSLASGEGSAETGRDRLAAVKQFLGGGAGTISASLIRQLTRDYTLYLYRFTDRLLPLNPDELPSLSPKGSQTNLGEAVAEAARTHRGLTGMVILSDGIDTSKRELTPILANLGLPLTTVAVGRPDRFKDVWLSDVRVPAMTFRGKPFTIDFTIRTHGLSGSTLPVVLRREGRVIATDLVRVRETRSQEHRQLSITLRDSGDYPFTLTVPPQPGEELLQNNRWDFSVRVVRDKIRVLIVAGHPSWEYRFWRLALRHDPNVELVSFVFLRTQSNPARVPEQELSLIPFPVEEIFSRELVNYDLLIFQDFPFRLYFPEVYLQRVTDFVRAGGGFILLGGPNSFNEGGYGGSSLAAILPVELEEGGSSYEPQPVQMHLTTGGERHPITQLLPDPQQNRQVWREMPSLLGYNRVKRLRPQGVLLGTHPTEVNAFGPLPLLTLGRYGKGRTAAFMTDSSWRWDFIQVGEGKEPLPYLRFLRQMVRWLVGEPSQDLVTLQPAQAEYRPGERADLTIKVLAEDYTPRPGAKVGLTLVDPQGRRTALAAQPGPVLGEYQANFVPQEEGAYRVAVEATYGGQPLGRAERTLTLSLPPLEMSDGSPRPHLLRELAQATGGQFYEVREGPKRLLAHLQHPKGRETLTEEQRLPLRSSVIVLALILLPLCLEWWLRRRLGLL